MGILKKVKLAWKTASTADKIGVILDVICGTGSWFVSSIAGKKLSEGRGIIERFCIRATMTGIGIAAGEVSSKALRENYGDVAAELIDKARGREKAEKEASADE